MVALRQFSFIMPLSLGLCLGGCSLVPFPEASTEEQEPVSKKAILPSISAPLKQQASAQMPPRTTVAQNFDLETAPNSYAPFPPQKPGAKTQSTAQLAALNMIKGRKPAGSNPISEDNYGAQSQPKTYRLDGPAPQNFTTPQNGYVPQMQPQQNYNQQAYVPQPQYMQHNPYAFQTPPITQNMVQNNGFQRPDLAPNMAPKSQDPKSVMDAIERARARQAVQPEQTGTLAVQPNNHGDPLPKGQLTFVQFDRGSTILTAAGQKSLSTMLAPHLRVKKAKLYLSVGLGGEGESYAKLLLANQRAQSICDRIPQQFEVIRRFDPALPNESSRLFVVE